MSYTLRLGYGRDVAVQEYIARKSGCQVYFADLAAPQQRDG
jgi:hypothetical protein